MNNFVHFVAMETKVRAAEGRKMLRDRMNRVKAAWLQSLAAISRQRDLSSSRSPRLSGPACRRGFLGLGRAHADRGGAS